MANRFSLDAVISPTIDDRAVDREVSDMQQSFEDGIGDVGVEGLGGARAGGGGGGGGGAAGMAGGAGVLSKLGGTAAKAAVPVALAGGAAFGILQGIQKLSEASPALQQTFSMFDSAMDLFFRPFGNFLANKLRPWADASINMATQFNKLAGEEGLAVATGTISAKIIKGGASATGERIGQRFESDEGMGLLETWLEDATDTDTFGNRLQESFAEEIGLEEPLIDVPKLTNDLKNDIVDAWPGWPDIDTEWPGWPDIGAMWPGWPDVNTEWGNIGWPNVSSQWAAIGWPNVQGEWGGWPDVDGLWDGWPDVSLPNDFWPTITVEDAKDALFNRGGGGGFGFGGGNGGGGGGTGGTQNMDRDDEKRLLRNIADGINNLDLSVNADEVIDPFLSR